MQGYIDIHNHSLPDIDDGAKSIAMALEMLEIAEKNGTKEIILTPHHLNGAFLNPTKKIKDCFKELQNAAIKRKINIKLHIGSEIHLTPETVEQTLSGNALSMCEMRKAALIELPKNSIPYGAESILSKLLYNNIIPILAHPERNSTLRRDSRQLKEWVSMGCKTQLTAMSCTNHFGEKIQTKSLQLISEGLVHFIASDAHRPNGRSPKLNTASNLITEKFGAKICSQLFYENPKRLITGQNIIDIPTTKLKSKAQNKKWLNFINK